MPEPEPTAILVILRPGTTNLEAATIRTALRMWNHIVDVRPVTKNNSEVIAEARARSEVVDSLTPIFEQLRGEINEVLSVATDSFEAIATDPPTTDPPAEVTPLPEQRQAQ